MDVSAYQMVENPAFAFAKMTVAPSSVKIASVIPRKVAARHKLATITYMRDSQETVAKTTTASTRRKGMKAAVLPKRKS